MKVAGLKAISTVVESTAILIQSKRPSNPQLVKIIASRIKGWIGTDSPARCDLVRLLTLSRFPKVHSVQI
jgi:ATP phosphoribosyltransferase